MCEAGVCRLCACVCVRVYMLSCVCSLESIPPVVLLIYVCVCACASVCTFVFMYSIHICMCVSACVGLLCWPRDVCTCAHAHVRTYVRVCIKVSSARDAKCYFHPFPLTPPSPPLARTQTPLVCIYSFECCLNRHHPF
jgi:hypothetical protein